MYDLYALATLLMRSMLSYLLRVSSRLSIVGLVVIESLDPWKCGALEYASRTGIVNTSLLKSA